jgi:hypothetical protein
MKSTLILIGLIYTRLTFGQSISQIKNNYQQLIQGRFGQYDNRLNKTNEIINLAQSIARHYGIQTKIETLHTSSGELKSYPALRILPQGKTASNQEALKLEKNFGGLKLYLSPYDLKRSGSNAFFDPNGSKIGVPYNFIYNELSESYWHELGHAKTYQKLINNIDDRYAGVLKLLKGQYLSNRNQHGYFRFSALDEFLMTAYSADLNMQKLYAIYRNTTPREFNSRANEEILANILFNLETAYYLSLQTIDICERSQIALRNGQYKIDTESIKLGDRLIKNVFAYRFTLDSYERVLDPSRRGTTMLSPIEKGSEITFYANSQNNSHLIHRLDHIKSKAQLYAEQTNQLKKMIGVRIMYADIASTDIEALAKALIGQFGID